MDIHDKTNIDNTQVNSIDNDLLLINQNIRNHQSLAMLECLIFLFFILLLMSTAHGQDEFDLMSLRPEYKPYACAQSATAVVLAYFEKEINSKDFSKEFRVHANGQTSVADIVRVCGQYDLHCKAYRGLSVNQIRDYLSTDFAVIVITFMSNSQHAVSLFGAEGDILATDMLQPLHLANIDNLQKALSNGAISIVIGKHSVPSLKWKKEYWYLMLLAACVFAGICIYWFLQNYERRVVK